MTGELVKLFDDELVQLVNGRLKTKDDKDNGCVLFRAAQAYLKSTTYESVVELIKHQLNQWSHSNTSDKPTTKG